MTFIPSHIKKYMKYKKKYLMLKNMVGGNRIKDKFIIFLNNTIVDGETIDVYYNNLESSEQNQFLNILYQAIYSKALSCNKYEKLTNESYPNNNINRILSNRNYVIDNVNESKNIIRESEITQIYKEINKLNEIRNLFEIDKSKLKEKMENINNNTGEYSKLEKHFIDNYIDQYYP